MESVSFSEQKVSLNNFFKNPLFFKKVYGESVSDVLCNLNKNHYDKVVDSMLVDSGLSITLDTIYFSLLATKITVSFR